MFFAFAVAFAASLAHELHAAHDEYIRRVASFLPGGPANLSSALAAYERRLERPYSREELVRQEIVFTDAALQCPESQLQAHGHPYGCGAKRSCGVRIPPMGQPCVVISVGSANGWSFERGFKSHKHCRIHTLDCTITPRIPEEIRSQVTFHKLCLTGDATAQTGAGASVRGGLAFISWQNFTSLIGLTEPPQLFKMDIEGFERGVVLDMIGDGRTSHLLPHEMALEVHWGAFARSAALFNPSELTAGSPGASDRVTPGEVAAFLLAMYRRGGYAILDRNDCRCDDPIYMRKLGKADSRSCKKSLESSHATELVLGRLSWMGHTSGMGRADRRGEASTVNGSSDGAGYAGRNGKAGGHGRSPGSGTGGGGTGSGGTGGGHHHHILGAVGSAQPEASAPSSRFGHAASMGKGRSLLVRRARVEIASH